MTEEELFKNAVVLLLKFLIKDSATWSDEKWAEFTNVTGMKKETLTGTFAGTKNPFMQ